MSIQSDQEKSGEFFLYKRYRQKSKGRIHALNSTTSGRESDARSSKCKCLAKILFVLASIVVIAGAAYLIARRGVKD